MATTEHEPRPSEPHRFGPALREAREAAGHTLEEVAHATRIRRSYLEALEAEDWGRVPRGVIGRGFVRLVAKEIGAPEAELLDLYHRCRPDEASVPARRLPEPDWEVSLRGGRRRLLPGGLGLVLVMAGLGAGWWFWGGAVPPAPQGPAVETVAPGGSTPAGEGDGAAAPEPEVPAEARAPEPPPGREAPAEETATRTTAPFTLEIRATEKAWVRVVADGGEPDDQVFQPGEKRTYEARNGFSVKLGNAGGVRFVWNGTLLKVPGRPGEVKEVRLPAELEALLP